MVHDARMRPLPRAAALLTASALLVACSSSADDAAATPSPACTPRPDGGAASPTALRMNHWQAKGTHNSYHVETAGNSEPSWHYTHAPLDVQLAEQGVRQVELDLHLDSLDADFEIFHLKWIDEQTTCRTLVDCLATLKAFSDAHPSHHAIYVQLEPKVGFPEDQPEAYFAKLEQTILSVFDRSRIVAPDDVRGCKDSLGDAVREDGWPTIDETRGKFLFGFDDDGVVRDAYSRGGTSLAGRLLFTDSDPGSATAALAIRNDPSGGLDAIHAALAANMMVRTMIDGAGEDEASDAAGLAAGLASGANWLSSDFPAPVAGMTYSASIPGGTPSRCNPVTAPEGCTPEAIEAAP